MGRNIDRFVSWWLTVRGYVYARITVKLYGKEYVGTWTRMRYHEAVKDFHTIVESAKAAKERGGTNLNAFSLKGAEGEEYSFTLEEFANSNFRLETKEVRS